MNIEELREYCLSKKEVTECLPFDDITLVFKVMDKVFALIKLDCELNITLKSNPDKAIELRESYNCIKPAFHMNKMHWNTILIDSSISTNLIYELIDDSYNLVVDKLTKKQKKNLLKL